MLSDSDAEASPSGRDLGISDKSTQRPGSSTAHETGAGVVQRLVHLSLDRAGEAIFWIAPDAGFVYVNDAACRSLGYSRDELTSLTVKAIRPDWTPENWNEHWEELKRRGSFTFETCHRRKDGTTFPVENAAHLLEFDGSEYKCVFARDLSERRQTDQRHRQLTTAIEQTAEAIVITDPNGVIHYVNPAFERVTGYSREEVLGKTPQLLRSGQHDNEFYRNLWKTIGSGQVWSGQFINRRKDGSIYQEEATISPVFDVSGCIANYVAVKRDVTERIKLEEQFLQAQKMEAIGRLAGGVAHDFNNLLTAIVGYSELNLFRLDRKDPLYADLQEIRKAAERATSLTRQLLAFGRKQLLQPKILDLNTVVTDMDNMLRRLIGEDIELSITLDPRPACVKADPSQIEQVIMNLVVNARDAMPQGGHLSIETASVEVLSDQLCRDRSAAPGPHILLSVSDTGQGMPPEILSKIFDPFFTTKEQGKGTGLGLSTVYGIIRQSEGCIAVESELGKGTTFRIYLPRVEGAADTLRAENTDAKVESGAETVLLVEDDELVRNLMRSILRKNGYTVLDARHGGEALLLCERHSGRIDLMVTDIIMYQMNGWDLAKRLRPLRPEMKVLYVSGYSERLQDQLGRVAERANFLPKPFSPEALARKVREVLDRV